MKNNLNINVIVVIVAVFLFALFIWPTIYRYDKYISRQNTYPVRTNRITGNSAIFRGDKWVSQDKNEDKIKVVRIPSEEIQKVTGNAEIGSSYFEGDIYNGTNWIITVLTIRIIAHDNTGSVIWDRKFEETTYILPFSTQDILFKIGECKYNTFDWNIEEIKGYQKKE